jgi:hypothetical protein
MVTVRDRVAARGTVACEGAAAAWFGFAFAGETAGGEPSPFRSGAVASDSTPLFAFDVVAAVRFASVARTGNVAARSTGTPEDFSPFGAGAPGAEPVGF